MEKRKETAVFKRVGSSPQRAHATRRGASLLT
jgi:hypothetical protein